MELTLLEPTDAGLRAGYTCPCGCTPAVTYVPGADLVEEGRCCGNHFAVGPRAAASLAATPGSRPKARLFATPWGERLEAGWLVGPRVHDPAPEHDHHAGPDHHTDRQTGASHAVDPVCGMTVDPETARSKGLQSTHDGRVYFFCGKGCKLEFDEDPERYLDRSYLPSM